MRIYAERSTQLPTVLEPKDEDSLLRFEYDLDGDRIPEIFLSRDSLRDGKQGYLWTMYAKSAPEESYREIGSTVFPDTMLSPKRNADGKLTHEGFYTCGPAGGGKGTVYFFSYANGTLENTESFNVDVHNKKEDAEFMERMFKHTDPNPLNVVRIPLKTVLAPNTNTPVPSSAPRSPGAPTAPGVVIPPVMKPLARKPDETPNEKGLQTTLLAITAAAALFGVIVPVIWKRRRDGAN
jgi:hypothetical protein